MFSFMLFKTKYANINLLSLVAQKTLKFLMMFFFTLLWRHIIWSRPKLVVTALLNEKCLTRKLTHIFLHYKHRPSNSWLIRPTSHCLATGRWNIFCHLDLFGVCTYYGSVMKIQKNNNNAIMRYRLKWVQHYN